MQRSKRTIGNLLLFAGGLVLIASALFAADVRAWLLELGDQYQFAALTKGSGEYLLEDQYLRGATGVFLAGAALTCFYFAALLKIWQDRGRQPG